MAHTHYHTCQHRAMKIMKGLEQLSYKKRLRKTIQLGVILLVCINTWRKGCPRGQSWSLFSGAHWQDKKQRTQNEAQEAPFEHQVAPDYCEDDWALVQVAHRDYGVSSLEIFKKYLDVVLGNCLRVSHLSRGIGTDALQRPLPTSTILRFWDLGNYFNSRFWTLKWDKHCQQCLIVS